MTKIADPLIELLALALYESDVRSENKPGVESWSMLDEEAREIWRSLARGETGFEE